VVSIFLSRSEIFEGLLVETIFAVCLEHLDPELLQLVQLGIHSLALLLKLLLTSLSHKLSGNNLTNWHV
jgi:hypothetical protein